MKTKIYQILIFCLFSSALLSFIMYERSSGYFYAALINFFVLNILIFGNSFISKISVKHFPRQIYGFKHLIIFIPSSVLLSILLLILHQFLYQTFHNKPQFINNEFFILLSLAISIFIITTFEGLEFFNYWKEYIIRTEKIEKNNLLAKYETLKNQLNTHFLFNTLNTLISFIENNNKIAAEYAQNLSDFLTYLLSYQKTNLIKISEELTIVNQYLFLQKPRLNNNIQTSILIDDIYLDTYVPPLTLQILVENAIKHNMASAEKKIIIKIFYENQYIFVRNNLNLNTNVNSTKTGINNITGRYQLFTEKEIIIEFTNDYFLIGVPVLTNTKP